MNCLVNKFFGVIVLFGLSFFGVAEPLKTQNLEIYKSNSSQVSELILIDADIEDFRDLIVDIKSSRVQDDIEIVQFNSNSSPLKNILESLKRHQNLNAIHLFTHGTSGNIVLGDESVDKNYISKNKSLFSPWANSLNEEGRILLYGCDISKGEQGKDFIKYLAKVTGANVQASNNRSGIKSVDQDWVLEDSTDKMHYASLITEEGSKRFKSSLEFINGNAFLNANNVIAGVGPDGAFGSNVPAPSGIFQGSRIGYLSDPSRNSFSGSYDGDFFLPGFPEEGWAVRVNDVNYNNNSNKQVVDIDGSLSNFQEFSRYSSVDWNGAVDQLGIKAVYRTYNKGLAIIIDVELTNTSSSTMKNVYYMRTVDPDNNVENVLNPTETFSTKNTILQQGGSGLGSAVNATQSDGSVVTLSGYSENTRVTYGLVQVRDPTDVFSGRNGLNSSGSKTEDTSISLAFKFKEILPGEAVRFTLSYALANIEFPTVKLDDDGSSGILNGSFKQVYLLGSAGKTIADDVTIEGPTTEILEGLKVKIINPSDGDRLRIVELLPAGLSFDSDEVNDNFEINITGAVEKQKYIQLIKSIRFENQNLDASLTPREIKVKVLDEGFTLSNGGDAQVFMTVPLTINENIAEDNILNKVESAQELLISGTTAPNSELTLTLTDNEGGSATEIISTNENRVWELNIASNKLVSLNEGMITVTASSIDQYGNETTAKTSFIKDTEIVIEITSPDNNSTIVDGSISLVGKSDPFTDIEITMPNDVKHSTRADPSGDWNLTIGAENFDLNTSLSISVDATDSAKNEASTSIVLKTPPHLVSITSLDANADKLAHSTRPTIQGTSLSGTEITVKITINGNDKFCTSTTNSNGDWSCKMSTLKSGGAYPVLVESEDTSNGAVVVTNEIIFIPNISLDIIDPVEDALISGDNPLVSGVSDSEATLVITTNDGKTCNATADGSGSWSCRLPDLEKGQSYLITVVAKDAANNQATDSTNVTISNLPLTVISPLFNGMVENDTPIIVGKTDPAVEITVTTEFDKTCKTFSDENGDWTCLLSKMPIGGPYDITVLAVDTSKDIESTVPWKLSIPDIPLLILSPFEGEVVTNTAIVVNGTTNPNADVTVSGINGQECMATSNDEGIWRCELTGLNSGIDQPIIVTSVLNGKEKQLVRIIQVDIPLLVSEPSENETVTKSPLLVIGKTDANSNVSVEGSEGEECNTVSDNNGDWSCTLTELLTGNGKVITIVSIDQNGGRKELTRIISILINDGEVQTVLKGGGAIPPTLLFIYLLLLVQRKKIEINKKK